MKMVNETTGEVVLENLSIADTFIKRFFGLMGKKYLNLGHGLKIEPCSSIHTFNMKFPIDVIFVSSDHKVVHVICSMKPGKISSVIKESRYVIEANENTLCGKIKIGDVIRFL